MSTRAADLFQLSGSYTPLLEHNPDGSESSLSDTSMKESSSSCPTCGAETRHTTAGNALSLKTAIIICLLCTSFNCLLVLFSRRGTTTSGPECNPSYRMADITRTQYTTLRRPSPFVGMANITRPVPPVSRSIINYPQVVALVDAERPGLVFDDDPLRYMSRTGTVSPEERKVHVTKSISTIVQFRAIDFGMEICELKLRIPPIEGGFASPSILSIHRLENESVLDTKTLSYKTRPHRVSDVGNIPILQGQSNVDWNRNFTCEWDSLMIFEIACFDRSGYSEGDGCDMEWWQGKDSDDPERAIFMMQHATV